MSRSEDMINLHRMEQELRVLARRAERLLGEQASRHNVAWSFRVWRGSIDTDLLSNLMLSSQPIRHWANAVLRDALSDKAEREWCLAPCLCATKQRLL